MKEIEALLDAGLIESANTEFIRNADLLSAAVKPNTRSEIQLERTKGRLYLARQQWSDAIAHLQRSITIARQAIGSDHPNLVWSLAPLARSYLGAQRDSETVATLNEARLIAGKWLSPNSRIWSQLNDIASLVGSRHSEAVKIGQNMNLTVRPDN